MKTLIDSDVAPDVLTASLQKLDEYNFQLDLLTLQSDTLLSIPVNAPDRRLNFVFNLDQIGVSTGEQVQIDFVQLGAFFWDPTWGTTLPDTIPAIRIIQAGPDNFLPYGIGRVGSQHVLEVEADISPESGCNGGSLRLLLRVTKDGNHRWIPLESPLSNETF